MQVVRAPVPILFTIPNFISAGSGRAMLNVASRLDRARFSPSVAVLRRGGSLEAELERLGIPLIEAAFTVAPRPLATLAWRAWTAAQPFRKRGFVLWHSYHYLDDYTEPIVSRLAGARSWIYTKKNMSWNHRSWWIRTFLARRVAAMNTDMLEHYLSPPRFRRKSVLLPPGVETETYRPGIPPRLELRTRLRTPASTPVIGCVANLVPIKGHTVLIEAMARVPGAHLWLAGAELDANYAGALRRRVAELGLAERVSFVGSVSDIPAFLAEIDVFVLPTPTGEGLGVALLEAMSCGVASVAFEIPGPRDVVESGRNGWLVPPGDSVALAEVIGRLAGDAELRRRLGSAARTRILERYSIDREVAAYEELYEELLQPRRAGKAA